MFEFKSTSIPGKIRASVADSDFRVYARSDGDEAAELLVMDSIGDDGWGGGILATDVVSFCSENQGRPINVRINSYGGSVYDGLVITNALLHHDADVTTTVEGVAYSAASVIAMGGGRKRMHQMSDLGIHRALVGAIGNKNTMLAVADWLETIDGHQISLFEWVTGKQESEVVDLLDGNDSGAFGSVFSSDQALEHGFIDEIIPMSGETQESASQKIKSRIAADVGSRIESHRVSMIRKRKMIDNL